MTNEFEIRLSDEQVQQLQLELLSKFDGLMLRCGGTYYVWAGTLLGAVRHGGYIPWDDDIDIAVPRSDYEQLVRMIADDPSLDLVLHSIRTNARYRHAYAKLSDARTISATDHLDGSRVGVHIDIFPLDAWPDGRIARAALGGLLRAVHRLNALKLVRPREEYPRHRRLVNWLVYQLLYVLPVPVLARWLDSLARRPFGKEWVGVTVFRYMERSPAGAYGPGLRLPFENLRVCAPSDPDAVLTSLYGDYHTPPPEAARTGHIRPAAFWTSARHVIPDDPTDS